MHAPMQGLHFQGVRERERAPGGGTRVASPWSMFLPNEAAARHRPIAYSRDARDVAKVERLDRARRAGSEGRLQVAVVKTTRDEVDPYADVPCTD